MNPTRNPLHFGKVLAFLASIAFLAIPSASAQSAAFPGGFSFNAGTSYLTPSNGGASLELSAYSGGLFLYGGATQSAHAMYDGGITLAGNPTDVLLASESLLGGVFRVWGENYFDEGQPLFEIDTATDEATFAAVDVVIDDGSLSVDGDIFTGASKVATESFVNSKLSSNLTLTGGTLLGVGTEKTAISGGTAIGAGGVGMASGTAGGSSSVGMSDGTANGNYSVAGGGGTAGALYSTAFSSGTSAGDYTFAAGPDTYAKAWGSVALGSATFQDTGADPELWVETDRIFAVGNGEDHFNRSNAITTLKNGRTTLTNKAWKAIEGSGNELVDPPATTTDSGGEALVVEGHTVLKGKVTIQVPQGDISMGIYGGE